MRILVLDGRQWKSTEDVYSVLLPALEAPDWHGHNLDALWDTVSGDDVNEVRAPYRITVQGPVQVELRSFLERVRQIFLEAKSRGLDVEFVF